jgi:hypothetical protein
VFVVATLFVWAAEEASISIQETTNATSVSIRAVKSANKLTSTYVRHVIPTTTLRQVVYVPLALYLSIIVWNVAPIQVGLMSAVIVWWDTIWIPLIHAPFAPASCQDAIDVVPRHTANSAWGHTL